ncbi:MAG TPA: hypothetical protein VI055_10290 [Rubrobacter sp.]|jgi:hypothetical protein
MKRRITLLITALMLALVMAAMMLVMAMPAFAGPKSENSCGKANPQFPANTGEGLDRCGVDNNRNSPDKPEGKPFQA